MSVLFQCLPYPLQEFALSRIPLRVTQQHASPRQGIGRHLPERFQGQHTCRHNRDIIQPGFQKRFGWAGETIVTNSLMVWPSCIHKLVLIPSRQGLSEILTRAIYSCCSFNSCILIETWPCLGFILRCVNTEPMTTNTKKSKICIIESAFFVPYSIVAIFPCFHGINAHKFQAKLVCSIIFFAFCFPRCT